jgi:hypothetical protein
MVANLNDPNLLKGFTHPIRVGCGGCERPFNYNGRTYLYVWDCVANKHYYHCYDDDTLHPDTLFSNVIDNHI